MRIFIVVEPVSVAIGEHGRDFLLRDCGDWDKSWFFGGICLFCGAVV